MFSAYIRRAEKKSKFGRSNHDCSAFSFACCNCCTTSCSPAFTDSATGCSYSLSTSISAAWLAFCTIIQFGVTTLLFEIGSVIPIQTRYRDYAMHSVKVEVVRFQHQTSCNSRTPNFTNRVILARLERGRKPWFSHFAFPIPHSSLPWPTEHRQRKPWFGAVRSGRFPTIDLILQLLTGIPSLTLPLLTLHLFDWLWVQWRKYLLKVLDSDGSVLIIR